MTVIVMTVVVIKNVCNWANLLTEF